MKQKTKYRYYWGITMTLWRVDQNNIWEAKTYSDWTKSNINLEKCFLSNEREVTLSQGLHYMKGNYCE